MMTPGLGRLSHIYIQSLPETFTNHCLAKSYNTHRKNQFIIQTDCTDLQSLQQQKEKKLCFHWTLNYTLHMLLLYHDYSNIYSIYSFYIFPQIICNSLSINFRKSLTLFYICLIEQHKLFFVIILYKCIFFRQFRTSVKCPALHMQWQMAKKIKQKSLEIADNTNIRALNISLELILMPSQYLRQLSQAFYCQGLSWHRHDDEIVQHNACPVFISRFGIVSVNIARVYTIKCLSGSDLVPIQFVKLVWIIVLIVRCFD